MLRGISVACATVSIMAQGTPTPYVGSYVLLNGPDGIAKLQLLAANAATIPINRLWVSFFSPTLMYVPGSNSLQYSGLNVSQSGDYGFAAIKTAITTLKAGGVDVLLSMGGWVST